MPDRPEDEQIRQEYESIRPEVSAFVELMVRLITQLCATDDISFQSISGRAPRMLIA